MLGSSRRWLFIDLPYASSISHISHRLVMCVHAAQPSAVTRCPAWGGLGVFSHTDVCVCSSYDKRPLVQPLRCELSGWPAHYLSIRRSHRASTCVFGLQIEEQGARTEVGSCCRQFRQMGFGWDAPLSPLSSSGFICHVRSAFISRDKPHARYGLHRSAARQPKRAPPHRTHA